MRRSTVLQALIAVAAFAATASAQLPGGPPEGRAPGGGPPGPMAGAEFLLAHTGELQLTDGQVTRLAAIARRADSRRRARLATLDSARAVRLRAEPDDSTRGRRRPGRRPPGAASPSVAELQQLRDQARTDLRDAITVLTADQQAQAWEMIATRGGARGGRPGIERGRR